MAGNTFNEIFDDPKRSQKLALTLGALGGPFVALGITLESVPVLILGIIGLAASGAVWTIRGIKEDQVEN